MHTKEDFQDALNYIYGLTALGWKPGLERFTALCERLGSPHKKLNAVHVGGTNGKGSTTAMVSAILQNAGYRVGTYYSPYVYNIRERVQLNGQMISEEDFTRLINIIRPEAAAIGETDMGHPTEFEVKTALGFLYFVEQNVDYAVLEVGLGGRLDATNIVTPLVSVITNVTLDHMDRLGNTVAEIAGEKAGIIKENGHVVTAASDPEAFKVIAGVCRERNAALWYVHPTDNSYTHFAIAAIDTEHPELPRLFDIGRAGDGLVVDGMSAAYADLTVRMQGNFQRINAATAIGAVEVLQQKGAHVPESAIRAGLKTAYLPARLEVLRRNPTLVIDGAHNLDAARRLAAAIKDQFQYDRLILVMGMVSGHSIENVIGTLAPMADKFYATAADSTRAASASSIAEAAGKYCPDVTIVEPVPAAVRQALAAAGENDLVVVTGSFYVINEVPRQL